MEAASEILPTLPRDQLNRVARFLEGRGEFSWWFRPSFCVAFFFLLASFLLRFRLSLLFLVVSLFSLFVSNFYSYSLSSFSSLMFVFYDVSSMLFPYQLFFCSPSLLPVSSLPCRVFFLLSFCVLHTPSLSSLSFSSLVVSLVFRRYYCFISGTGFPPSLLSLPLSFLSFFLLPCLFSLPSCFLVVSLFLPSFLLPCCLFLSSSLSWFGLPVYISLLFPLGPFLLRFRLSSFFLVLSLFSLLVCFFVSNFYSSSLSSLPSSFSFLSSSFLAVFYILPCRVLSFVSSYLLSPFAILSFFLLLQIPPNLVSDRPTNRPQRARHSSNNRPRSQI